MLGRVIRGLRERKKTDTRRALAETALALGLERGYPHFTIADVVDRVGVSRRTFSNYFASKADCFVAVTDGWGDEVLDALLHAPAGMHLDALLREALVRLTDLVVTRFDSYLAVVRQEPELQAAAAVSESARCARIATAIANRLGLTRSDPRPDLLARFGGAAVQSCLESWWADGRPDGADGVAGRLDVAFALLDLSALEPSQPSRPAQPTQPSQPSRPAEPTQPSLPARPARSAAAPSRT